MIPRNEFYIALSLALAAASAPQGKETPLEMGSARPDPDLICFDFWPGDKLKIVGTNGRRLACSTLHLPGAGLIGKFVMHVNQASEALLTFAPGAVEPPQPRCVNLGLFGIEQMILTCSGGVDAMMVESANKLFPEYNIMLQGGNEPTKDAVYDAHTLGWVMDQVTPLAESGLAVHVRQFGPSTFRPQLAPGYRCLQDVVIAIKPFHTW